MTIGYIRRFYQVPAKVGGRIVYDGTHKDPRQPRAGTIISARGQYLTVRFDDRVKKSHTALLHPTSDIEYRDPADESKILWPEHHSYERAYISADYSQVAVICYPCRTETSHTSWADAETACRAHNDEKHPADEPAEKAVPL
jgi:hypothetical protein